MKQRGYHPKRPAILDFWIFYSFLKHLLLFFVISMLNQNQNAMNFKHFLLLFVGLSAASPSFAEYIARVTNTVQTGGCAYITVTVWDDNGTPNDRSDDTRIGSTTLSTGPDCPGGNPDPDPVTSGETYENIEVDQNPSNEGMIEVDYAGNKYDQGRIDAIFGDSISLKGRGLSFQGREKIDISGLDRGWYLIQFRSQDERIALGTFKVD
jgi:hypothetical protein